MLVLFGICFQSCSAKLCGGHKAKYFNTKLKQQNKTILTAVSIAFLLKRYNISEVFVHAMEGLSKKCKKVAS